MKNNSEALKNFKVKGNKNLNTKAKIKTETTEAIAVVLRVMFLYVLKKYNITIDGITSSDKIWTPKDRPTMKLIRISHLFPRGVSISLSHFNPNQNSIAIKKDDMAYTSPSTALNQKLSEKV